MVCEQPLAFFSIYFSFQSINCDARVRTRGKMVARRGESGYVSSRALFRVTLDGLRGAAKVSTTY